MEFKYKQLEHELSALSRVFGELGARLSEVAKDVTSPGVTPPDKLIEQISTARTNFDNVRGAVHAHAATMLVSPLPKIGEVVSITAVDTLLKASAAAEENKLSIESERDRALAILSRVLAITHKETSDFKPLQECHAKVDELRNGISKVAWPHRHPESDSVIGSKHPYTTLLSFVENLDTLEDDRWIVLETTITETFGKPLFVAASRGKLVVPKATVAEKPTVAAPAPVASAPAAPAPIVEKPVEKKAVAEKAPEKPAAHVPAHVEKKVAPPAPAPAPPPVAATPQKPAAAPTLTTEKKDTVEKPQTVVAAPPQPAAPAPAPIPSVAPATVHATPTPAPAPAAPAAAAQTTTPAAPVAPAPVIAATSTPAPTAPAPTIPAAAAPAPPTPTPLRATPAPAAVATPAPAAATVATPVASAPVASAPASAPIAAAPAAAPVASAHAPAPQPAASVTNAPTSQTNIPSLTALATATEPAVDRKTSTTVETIDKQRKEPRLAAAPAPQPVAAKSEPKSQEAEMVADNQSGDGSQRPQRWGFWRGNR